MLDKETRYSLVARMLTTGYMATVVEIDAVRVDPAWLISAELCWRIGIVSAI
jgi:hypothetical protein